MKNKYGFTIVELLVVIVVLGIIATISVASYITVQKQSRDGQRTASARIINDSLEQYYTDNGEYPSVAKITATNANTPKSLLGLNNLDSFIAPRAPAGTTTNLWKGGTASNANKLTYTGNTDTSVSCLTGSTATDVCDDYKIQYYVEKTGTVETIYSQNKAATPPPPPPPPAAPAPPTLAVALNAGRAVATTAAASCAGSASPEYAFRSRTNDGTWSSYTAWSVTITNSSAAVTQGTKYGFQVKARCVDGSLISSESAASTERTYIHPISTPAAPGVYATTGFRPNYNGGLCIDASGQGNTNGTAIQVYTCNGTAAQDWAYNSNDRTIRPTYNMNLCVTNQGGGMQLVLWTCDGSTARQWNYDTRGYFVSVSTGHCMDAVNWGGSGTAIAAGNCNNATAQIWNPSDSQTAWTWANTACPAGTSVEYRVNYQTTNLSDSGWASAGVTPRVVRTTSSQGYTYTTQAQSRCYTTFATSAWSSTGQSSINKAVFRPGGVTGWTFGVWSGRLGWGWSWDSPACGIGTNRSYIEESWMGVNNNSGGSIEYWISPRQPNGPGNVWWYTANSTSGAAYIWYTPDAGGRGESWVSHPSRPVTSGLDVVARAQYRCENPTTGQSATGDWSQSAFYYM